MGAGSAAGFAVVELKLKADAVVVGSVVAADVPNLLSDGVDVVVVAGNLNPSDALGADEFVP